MSKVLRGAAIVVGAVALVATGIATANPGLVVAGVKIGTVATVATLSATALSLAATVAAKKPKVSQGGNQTEFTANMNQGIPYVMGATAASAVILWRSP